MSCSTFLLTRKSFLLSWGALWLSVSGTTSTLQNPSTCLESGQTFFLTAAAAWLLPFSPAVQPHCDVTLTKCATDLGALSFWKVHDPLWYYMAGNSSHLFLPFLTLYWSSVVWALSYLGCGNGLLQQQPLWIGWVFFHWHCIVLFREVLAPALDLLGFSACFFSYMWWRHMITLHCKGYLVFLKAQCDTLPGPVSLGTGLCHESPCALRVLPRCRLELEWCSVPWSLVQLWPVELWA